MGRHIFKSGIAGKIGRAISTGLILASTSLSPALAQDGASRYPATGIKILNCQPDTPAPKESCLVQLRPGMERGLLNASGSAEFNFVKPGDPAFPRDLSLSATLVLIDTTPGIGGARRGTFNQERRVISEFISGLPRGEQVAIYGFSDKIDQITNFTTDRAELSETIDNLKLSGVNTRIRSSVLDAISVLKERDDVLIKNIILMTDGDEEGRKGAVEISEAAVEAGIPISAVGLEWRAPGAPDTARSEDYLESITDATAGETVMVRVRRTQEAITEVQAFARRLQTAKNNSGLILPSGTPRASEITVDLIENLPGSSETRTTKASVNFVPTQAPDPEVDKEPEVKKIFGLPEMWAYIIGALLLLLLALLLFLILRKKAPDTDDTLIFDDVEDDIAGGSSDDDSTRIVRAPTPSAIAYLVSQSGRYPVSSARVAIGRGNSNAIVISDDSISRVHAELHRNRDGGFSITDMDSLNGTFVNGKAIKGTAPVRAGDTLKFGEVSTKLILA